MGKPPTNFMSRHTRVRLAVHVRAGCARNIHKNAFIHFSEKKYGNIAGSRARAISGNAEIMIASIKCKKKQKRKKERKKTEGKREEKQCGKCENLSCWYILPHFLPHIA
jgi:hypothetical protein